MRMQDRSLALLSGLRIRRCCELGVSHRCSSDPVLLWLWCRPAATAPIGPLAWEPPYAMGAALQKTKRQKEKKKLKKENPSYIYSMAEAHISECQLNEYVPR